MIGKKNLLDIICTEAVEGTLFTCSVCGAMLRADESCSHFGAPASRRFIRDAERPDSVLTTGQENIQEKGERNE